MREEQQHMSKQGEYYSQKILPMLHTLKLMHFHVSVYLNHTRKIKSALGTYVKLASQETSQHKNYSTVKTQLAYRSFLSSFPKVLTI